MTRSDIEKLEQEKEKLVKKFDQLHARADEVKRQIADKEKEIKSAYDKYKRTLK